jgi:hypothetical protein
MKKFMITLLLAIMPSIFLAQTTAFDKFEKDGVDAVIVNKKMFELMGNVKMDPKDKTAQQYLNLIKKLDNLKVFTTTSPKIVTEMKGTVDGYLKKYPLEELMRMNEGTRTVKIYVKSGATSSQVKELLMFMEGGSAKESTVLMSLTGNFDLSEISFLTDYMKLPGGPSLKKASKK